MIAEDAALPAPVRRTEGWRINIGDTDMADHGKMDNKKEQKKKAQFTLKEKRKLKKEKKKQQV